jgi:hypothetical protein
MDRCVGAAARLPEGDRRDLAVQVLSRSEPVSDLATRHGVSRKFVYQQTHKARVALDDAFRSATPDDEGLFELVVTKVWLRQVIIALALICRGSCRGVIEFVRDLLGVSMSVGTVHQVLQSAARTAGIINHEQDLSAIRVGLHDELFQGAMPVLAGVDAQSTYCYLLAAAGHRDADTWGVHLLDATRQGLKPDYTIADAGQGLRAGQKAARGDTPCQWRREFGSPALSVLSLRYVACRTRARSRAKPARPYIVRFSILSRFIWPSAGLVVQGRSRAACTALRSRRRLETNDPSAVLLASSSTLSSVSLLLRRRTALSRFAAATHSASAGTCSRTRETKFCSLGVSVSSVISWRAT